VDAEVVEIVDATASASEQYPRVAYEFNGVTHCVLAMDWYSVGLMSPVGSKIKLLVNPKKPGTCAIFSETHFRMDRLIL
jgi:hypothetical protein